MTSRKLGFTLAAALLGCAAVPPLAAAADAAPAADEAAPPAPAWTATANVALTNAYFFRGMNYTRGRPAIQGGFDVAHSRGFYAGVWASNVDPDSFLGAPNAEVDLYGGFTFPVGAITADVGVLQFVYPQVNTPNTTELYVAGTWNWLNLKYSHAVTDFFGYAGSSGSGYVEGNINYEFAPTWVLNLHAGYQNVRGGYDASYTDYRAGITKNFDGGWQVSVAGVNTTGVNKEFWVSSKGYQTDHLRYQVMVKRTF